MICLNKASQSTKKYKHSFTRAFLHAARLIILAALAALVPVFSACRNDQPAVLSYEPNVLFPYQFSGFAKDKKIYLTSIGQSVEIMQLMLTMNTFDGLEYTEDNLLEADEVEEGAVVFIVVGCSIKSLTENGLTKESETERAQAFIDRAADGDFGLVCWHLGGVARRGATSDSLIELLFGNCDLALFKAEGNYDNKLSDWAISGNVPYCQFRTNATDMLSRLLGVTDV